VPVAFFCRWVETPVSTDAERATIAREALIGDQAAMVFYLEEDGDPRVQYLLRGSRNTHTLTRRLEGTGDLSVGDSMALITLTTVELLLDTGVLNSPEPASSPPPAPPAASKPRLFIDAGYRLLSASAAPDLSHGFVLKASWRFWKPLRVSVSAGFSSPLSSSEDGVEMSQTSYPFGFGLSLMHKTGRVSFGGSAEMLFSAVHLTARASDDFNIFTPDTAFEFSLMASLSVEVEVAPQFALFAGPVLQVIPQNVVYAVMDGPVLFDEYRHVRPGITAGAQFFAF